MSSPFTPPDLDLRDFPYLPIDIGRLFGSQFHAIASDAEWRAGMILWLKSYHQVPAASLPDDDVALARLAEFGRDVRGWKKVRDVALRGWVLCDDGRLYHPVVAEKALVAWIEKLGRRKSSEAGNAKRWGSGFGSPTIDDAIRCAAGMLAALDPGSRTLKRKFVLESCRDPGGTPEAYPHGTPHGTPGRNPEVIPVLSQENEKEKGREYNPPLVPPCGGTDPAGSCLEPLKPRRRKPATLPMPARESGEFAALREAFFAYGRSKQFLDRAISDEFDAFIGHHQAKGNVFADWTAAGQNWLRRTQQFNQPRGITQQGRPQI
jgi:hypothetical protein